MAPEAGAQGLADRPELHRDQLGLRHRVAVAVHQAGRAVARLAQDGRVGRADQLHAHLARRGDQRLADHGVVDRAETVVMPLSAGSDCPTHRGSPSSRAAPRSSRYSLRSRPDRRSSGPAVSASAAWRAQSIQAVAVEDARLLRRARSSVSRSSLRRGADRQGGADAQGHDLDRPVERGAMHEGAVMGIGEQLGDILARRAWRAGRPGSRRRPRRPGRRSACRACGCRPARPAASCRRTARRAARASRRRSCRPPWPPPRRASSCA